MDRPFQIVAATTVTGSELLAFALIASWALVAAWAAGWFVHRYRSAEDEEGYEFAELGAACCPACGHELSLGDAAPIRSLRCTECSRPLPTSWWITHLLTIAGVVAVAAAWGIGPVLLALLWLPPVLVVAAVVDFRTLLIPKRVAWIGLGVGIATITVSSLVLGIPSSVLTALVGAVAYFVVLFVAHVVYPAGMGFGDVRLAPLLGLYLGWIDLALPLTGLLVANLVYLAYAIPARMRFGADNRFSPFGPGLALGTMLVVVFHALTLG